MKEKIYRQVVIFLVALMVFVAFNFGTGAANAGKWYGVVLEIPAAFLIFFALNALL